ncbi:MAG: hypothetical protein IPF98_24230 [Gemmatimonadetes bacterium]|nr:hypothetical protein [Gemmatimonadota bacterium]MCC6773029.1 hypothetical protein [Gemmatimonadaceae bacterium]
MYRLLASCLLVVSAHAAAAQQIPRVRIGIIGHPGPVSVDSLATEVTIAAPRGVTFRALAQVLAELKVPVDTRDSTRGIIGVMSVPRMRTFGTGRISKYLNCGSGMTGLNADNWRVYVTALAFVEAADSATTTLRLAMIGGAQDVAGSSTDPVACGSTGSFESLVIERLKARIASPIG